MILRSCLLALALVAALPAPPAAAGTEGDEAAAAEAAGKWLSLVDDGRYAESWTQAAGLFRRSVPKADWEQKARAAREPLGRLVSRKPKGAISRTELPGVPDGRYVVLEYESSFEHKKSAVETVTPTLDDDGTWKVSGYYIR